MTCYVRNCKNDRFLPWFVCFAHAEHLSVKKQPIEQGPIPYVEPPRPKQPQPESPGEIRRWIGYLKTVAKSA